MCYCTKTHTKETKSKKQARRATAHQLEVGAPKLIVSYIVQDHIQTKLNYPLSDLHIGAVGFFRLFFRLFFRFFLRSANIFANIYGNICRAQKKAQKKAEK